MPLSQHHSIDIWLMRLQLELTGEQSACLVDTAEVPEDVDEGSDDLDRVFVRRADCHAGSRW